jgi:hypothetical protein
MRTGLRFFEGDKRSYHLAIALDDFFPSDPMTSSRLTSSPLTSSF